jgi:hypothetical protein
MNSEDDTLSENMWIDMERTKVCAYLATTGIEHGGVGDYPAFHIHPYLSVWAVQSKRWPGAIGWWAIGGDMPTDYMSGDDAKHPRQVLEHFSRQWITISDYMSRGEAYPGTNIGRRENWPTLAPLLKSRGEILGEWAADDELWDEEEDQPS